MRKGNVIIGNSPCRILPKECTHLNKCSTLTAGQNLLQNMQPDAQPCEPIWAIMDDFDTRPLKITNFFAVDLSRHCLSYTCPSKPRSTCQTRVIQRYLTESPRKSMLESTTHGVLQSQLAIHWLLSICNLRKLVMVCTVFIRLDVHCAWTIPEQSP